MRFQSLEYKDGSDQPSALNGTGVRFALDNLAQFPDPTLVLSATDVLYANEHSALLREALEDPSSGLAEIRDLCLRSSVPVIKKINLSRISGAHQFELYALPVQTDEGETVVLMLSRDTTLEQTLTNALASSRQMFKDLLSCASDFGWETDQNGCFRYVTPQDAFGFSAQDLHNQNAAVLFSLEGLYDNPFETKIRSEPVLITIRRRDGSHALVQISATPITNQDGKWIGARGICRDITQDYNQSATVQRLEQRHHILTKIGTLCRSRMSHEEILTALTQLIGQQVKAHCIIFEKTTSGLQISAPSSHSFPTLAYIETELFNIAQQLEHKNAGGLIFRMLKDQHLLIAPTRHHGVLNGAVVLIADHPKHPEFDDHNLAIIEEAAEHLGMFLHLVDLQKLQDRLAIEDELTGLLNRAAFEKFLKLRSAHLSRSGGESALLMIEIDGFDHLLQRYPSACIDTAIQNVAVELQNRSRGSDSIARVGAAKFSLFLEDTSLTGAAHKARNIIRNCAHISIGRISGNTPITVSVGIIATDDMRPYSASELVTAAQNALAVAKSMGPATHVIGDLPLKGSDAR